MTIKGRQLFVGNLPYVVSWQELKDLFRKAGSVQRANIILSREGHSKGHGIVLYATVADAQKAISEFDGYEWHGRKLEVREDRSAMDYPPPPPRTEGANSINQNEESDKATSTNGLPSSANSNDVNGISSNQTTVPTPVDYSITNNNEILNVNGTNINGTTNGVTTYNEEYTNNYSNHNSHNPHNSSTLQRQLFVGNLPFRVRWQDLKDLFREAGTVIRADVAMGYDNRSKGHGTVLFATLEEAKNAIAMFNQKNWQGRTLEVREDRGFVDPNIHNNINGNGHHHQHHHHHHLQDHSRRVIDPTNHSHTQNPYGPGGPVMGMGGLFYGPRVQAPQPNYAGRLLFVGNLPFNCQWQDLKDLFRNAGNIIRADVSTNFDGRSRGFGTVLFATPEDARNAVGMYDGYEFQGRTLRVHFDRFSLPLPPHHHNPPPHPAHLPPPVHPHHRPPPLISHHNFHIGPPPIPHHFLPPAHMGPFSPPLTTPSLTSPPFPVSYNHLAHLNNHPNANTNASSPFQPIQPIPIVSSAGSIHGIGTNSQQTSTQSSQSTQDQPISTPTTQFPGFGPIGKTNHSPQSSVTSTISNLGAVGAFPSNTTNGIANNNGISGTTDGNNNNYGSGNDNAIHGLTSTFASLHLSHLGQAPQLFFHPHPHHRHPVIPTAYHPHHHQVAAAVHHQQHHHHHQHSHGQHPHHHHHPGAIGSGLVGINAHIHNQVNGTSDSSVSITTTSGLGSVVNPPSSSSHITKETDNGSKNDIIGSSSTTTEVTNNSANNSNNSSNTSVPGLWDNSASTMLSTAAAVSNGPSGTVNSGSVISIGMTSSLTGMGGLDNPAVGVSPLYL